LETRTYWLSFAAEDTGFRGACVVDVTQEDADIELEETPWMYDKVNGPWLAAAARKAWLVGANPGGAIASLRLPASEKASELPRNRLMSREEIEDRGWV
jgi:hypothetical protein